MIRSLVEVALLLRINKDIRGFCSIEHCTLVSFFALILFISFLYH